MFSHKLAPLLRHGARNRILLLPRIHATSVKCYVSEVTTPDIYMEGKKPKTNLPFAKDLFLGKFDKSMLTFPEILEDHELEELNMMVQPIEKLFREDLDSASMDENAKIPDDALQKIKELGLFGQQIPQEYGGLGLNATQYARIGEFTSLDPGVNVTLAAHQAIGLKGILIVGTKEQKDKYLPSLATGEKIAAFALTEPQSGSDAASIQTRAVQSEDGKTFRITGNKIWISNGGIADVFTVFAKTEIKNDEGEVQDKITAFIVERKFGGVSHGKPEDKLGIRCSNTCQVFFDNTPVPIENVLGEVGGGFKVAMNILNSGRFSMGSSLAGGLRHIIAEACEYAKSRKQFGKSISEFGLIQDKFARMAVYAYVMESMTFRTAAILDSYEEPDASVEAAMVKVFSSTHAWDLVSEALQVLGGIGYTKDYPFERYLRDCRICLIFEGTNEILRLYIALTCLQHAGVQLKELLKKLRNPFNNLGLMWQKSKERRDASKNKLHELKNQVHPVLADEADRLETYVNKLRLTVEAYLAKYKNEIVDEQMAVARMADVGIEIYAMTSVLARASRSKCIGLRNCDHEVMIAQTFCKESCDRCDYHFKQLDLDKFKNCDANYEEIAQKIFDNDGYVAEHPLNRTWKS